MAVNRYVVVNTGFGMYGYFDGDNNPLTDAQALEAAEDMARDIRGDNNEIVGFVIPALVVGEE